MKIQDIIYITVLILLLWKQDKRIAAIAGLSCLAFSIPFFSLWIFFTAERLTWYGASFILLAIIFELKSKKNTPI